MSGGPPGGRTANPQACDAPTVRREGMNTQPADSDYSVVDSCQSLWKPFRHRNLACRSCFPPARPTGAASPTRLRPLGGPAFHDLLPDGARPSIGERSHTSWRY